MKKFILSLSFLGVLNAYAFMNTYDPRYAQQGGVMPGQLATGEMQSNMMNAQVCPPQAQPLQAPLGPQMMPNMQQQYNQGIHSQQFFQPQQRMQ